MRLNELRLERYGAFDARTITIPDSAGFTVIYGPNEAGKSTWLSALSDFLFGIPERTPHSNVFGYDGMRVGAQLVDAAGVALNLTRRRGRGITLIDENGVGADEARLVKLLGATTRERFANLFGLNHESLRSGGEQLLKADGEIGRLIVEAGGGLRSLMARLDAVDAEAASLFSTRRAGERAFYKSLDAYNIAAELAKEQSVSRDAYEMARKNSLNAITRLDDFRSTRTELRAEISSLERLIRAVPHLLTHARVQQELESFTDIAGLDAEFHIKVAWAIDNITRSAEALEVAYANRERLLASYDAFAVDEAVLGAETRIRDLHEKAILVRKARADRANRVLALEKAEMDLASLRRMLQLPVDGDLEARLPQQGALDLVQRLAVEAIKRDTSLKAAQASADNMQDRLSVLKRRIDESSENGYDQAPRFGSAQFATLPHQVAIFEALNREAVEANSEAGRSAEALGFADIDELKNLACPNPTLIAAERQWHDTQSSAAFDKGQECSAAELRAAAAKRTIEQLESSGIVASAQSLAEIRKARDTSWLPVRSAYLAGTAPTDATERKDTVGDFEHFVETADDVADRLASEAERAAKLFLAQEQLSENDATCEAIQKSLASIEAALATRAAAFCAAFPEATALHAELAALLDFAERRAAAIAQADDALLLTNKAHQVRAELDPLMAIFSQAIADSAVTLPVDCSLAMQTQILSASLTNHETAHSEFRRDKRDSEQLQPEADRIDTQLTHLKDQEKEWQKQWPVALAALGLDADLAPESAGTLISEWSSARATLTTIKEIRTRLTRMDDDETVLKDLALSLGTTLSLYLPEDATAAADLIDARWTEHDGLRKRRLALFPEVEEAKAVYSTLEKTHNSAQGAIVELAAQASCAPAEGALREVAGRCSQRAALDESLGQAESLIASVDDGFGMESLIEKLGGRDIDLLRAALTEAEERAEQLTEEIEVAVLEKRQSDDALDAFRNETGLNAAISVRESAATSMQVTLDRYIELKVARGLIAHAIDQVRNEQQDPLVRRAGEHFAFTTQNEYSGVGTDIDEKGAPIVVGIRASGTQVPVTAMSDGTRDQLFLAFRLASLENYSGVSEPLPFVADDLLVHFDDERSSATLDLLAQFGQNNQVLLFTHHVSVRNEAQRLEAEGRANVVEI